MNELAQLGVPLSVLQNGLTSSGPNLGSAQFPVVREQFALHERPNLHLALEQLLQGHDELELIGVIDYDYDLSLGRLASKGSRKRFEIGPVEYIDVPLAAGKRSSRCITR